MEVEEAEAHEEVCGCRESFLPFVFSTFLSSFREGWWDVVGCWRCEGSCSIVRLLKRAMADPKERDLNPSKAKQKVRADLFSPSPSLPTPFPLFSSTDATKRPDRPRSSSEGSVTRPLSSLVVVVFVQEWREGGVASGSVLGRAVGVGFLGRRGVGIVVVLNEYVDCMRR